MQKVRPADEDYPFSSRKTKAPLTIQAVNAMVKIWTKMVHLDHGNYGAHTLRKTFGFMQRTRFVVGFEVLAKRFNHSSPATTMRYLGLTYDDEVNIPRIERFLDSGNCRLPWRLPAGRVKKGVDMLEQMFNANVQYACSILRRP